MSQFKAVVLEKIDNKITVLTTDGAFQTLKYKGNVEIGEEILLPSPKRFPIWKMGVSVAAVLLLTFMGIFGWSAFLPRTAVAMISLDINPSLQLTVDQKGEVMELESLNPEAEQLIEGLDLKGKAWREAVNEIIQKSVALNYLTEEQNWVVVGYSSVEPEKKLPAETLNPVEITKQVQEAVSEKGLKPTVAVYELTAEQKEQAQATGLSLGEYALVDTAQKAGVNVKPEAIKQAKELKRLLETPEIQEQLRKDKHIIESINDFLGENLEISPSNWNNSKNKNENFNKENGKDKDKNNNKDNNKNKNKDKDKDSSRDNSWNSKNAKDRDSSNEDYDKFNQLKSYKDGQDARGPGSQGLLQERSNKNGSKEDSRGTEKRENKKGDQENKNDKSKDNKDKSKEYNGNRQKNSSANYEWRDKKDDHNYIKPDWDRKDDNHSQYEYDFRTIFRYSFSQRT